MDWINPKSILCHISHLLCTTFIKWDILYLVLFTTSTIFLLQFGSSNSLQAINNELRCSFNPNQFGASDKLVPLHDCDAFLHQGKIRVRCKIYAFTSKKLPLLPEATTGILLTDYMETVENQDDILTQPRSSSCLQFLSCRIQRYDESYPEMSKRYNSYSLPSVSFEMLMLIQIMDVQTLFNSDYAVGSVQFNKTCLQLKNSDSSKQLANDSLVVSSCISSVDVLQRFVAPADTYHYFFANMIDLIKMELLGAILTIMDQIFLVGYNGSVPHLTYRTLKVDVYSYKIVPTNALRMLSQRQVISIDFNGNQFPRIKNGDIPQMNSLRELDLSDCQIDVIEPKAFDGAISLQRLNLKGNNLKELPFTLQPLRNLENLDLRSNAKYDFQKDKHILDHSNLRSLALSSTMLSGFWENLGNLSKLETLDISNCSIQYIAVENVSSLIPNLIHVNLSNNNLNNINVHFFWGLNNLQTLDLSRNLLSQFQYNTTIGMLPSLISILLNTNGVREFLPITLPSDSPLRNLDLSLNKIISWHKPKLNMREKILTLNLVGNNLTEVDSPMIQDFDTLKQVLLAENTFDCRSCTLKNFLAWINSSNTSTDFQNSRYTCFFPKEYFEKDIMEISPELCPPFNWLVVIIPIAVIVAFIAAITAVAVTYRWQLVYFFYLFQDQLRKHRQRQDGTVFKFDAFVSYCTSDRNWVVEHLIPSIETQEPKLHLCVHERDFEVGDTIMNNIIDCIDNCHKSIFVLSQHFIGSQWCQWELQMAQHKLFEDKRDVLILVMFGELNKKETPKLLKRLISTQTYLQWPDHENGYRLFYRRLRDAIGKCQCINKI